MVRASIFENGELRVGEVLLPELRSEQIRVAPFATGICGSDLSAWEHTEDFLTSGLEAGANGSRFDPKRPVVFGHEFTGRVIEVGSEVTDFAVGDVLFVLPWVIDDKDTVCTVGYTNDYPGALAEEVIVHGAGHIKLDDDIDPYLATVLEAIATGTNGAMRTGIPEGHGAIVTGVGPVGLGSVIELATRGAYPIVASDPSPTRREIALEYGATHAVDPRAEDPVDVWRQHAPEGSRLHVVEASGAPGVLPRLINAAPMYSVFSVVGANTRPEEWRTMSAINKNASVYFVTGPWYGETRYEALWRAYEHLREKRFDPARMITGYCGIEGTEAAFRALRPESGAIEHMKLIVRHDRDSAEVIAT
jgi:threonine dehydrogenase-like Zn-dependent dehydrogenase